MADAKDVANSGKSMNVGKQLSEVKLSNIIRDMGIGIAQAQFELDKTSLRIAQMMSGTKYETDEIVKDKKGEPVLDDNGMPQMVMRGPNLVNFNGKMYSMLELGFTPSFYQFVDTILEIKMSISMTMEESASESSEKFASAAAVAWTPIGGGTAMAATTVSAAYASKYQYSAEGSSLIRTKLVPVPPPAILEERIRKIMDENPVEREDPAIVAKRAGIAAGEAATEKTTAEGELTTAKSVEKTAQDAADAAVSDKKIAQTVWENAGEAEKEAKATELKVATEKEEATGRALASAKLETSKASIKATAATAKAALATQAFTVASEKAAAAAAAKAGS